MYRIAICDDNIMVCSEIERYLQEYAKEESLNDIETEVFLSGEELCRVIQSDSNAFHMIFLDIELGGMNGISVGNILREEIKNEITQVVFISYSQDYAMQLFKIRPMDFLLKPITYKKVYDVMQIYRKLFPDKKLFFEYKWGKNIYQIDQNKIIYIKCEGKKFVLSPPGRKLNFMGRWLMQVNNLIP